MDLIDHWVVGFAGNRELSDPEKLRTRLRGVLEEIKKLSDGQFVAMSSAAMGADLLFADEAARAGMPWVCVLPFPAEAFFNERDFPDQLVREAARRRLSKAADVETLRTPRQIDDLKDRTWRQAAFAEAGFRCVEEADLVVAVLQEGAAGKPGGTAETVAHARLAKRPLLLVDPETCQVRRENWPEKHLRDELTEQLRKLPTGNLSPEDRETLSLTTARAVKVAEWRSGFARAARRHVPSIRRRTSAVVILHALATIITACLFSILRPGQLGSQTHALMELAAFLFVLTGLLFLIWMIWRQPQVQAANYRFAAEIGRSILATWDIPEAGRQIVRGIPDRFRHFARTLILNQRVDPERQRSRAEISAEEVELIAGDYTRRRIAPQLRYYSKEGGSAKRKARTIEISSLFLSFTAVVAAGFLAFAHGPEFQRALWGFAKLAAATAAPVAVSILVIHEIKRREARYHEMEQALRQSAQELSEARSLIALCVIVTDLERLVLSECHEWWVLAKANIAA